MTKLYPVALYAENERQYRVIAATVISNSRADAKKLGLESAKAKWPASEGWANHDCSVGEISPEELAQVVDAEMPADSTSRVVFSGDDVIGSAVERLSKTDPTKVQEIVARQVELLTIYHNVVLDQAKRSFRWALVAAMAGFAFYLAAVIFVLLRQPESIAIISVISGALIQVISGINFYLYGRTSAQLADFQSRLDRSQRFLLANSVCEGLEGEHKQQARAALVNVIAVSPEHGSRAELKTV